MTVRLRPWSLPWRIWTCHTAYRYDGLRAAWRWIVYSEDPSAEYEEGE